MAKERHYEKPTLLFSTLDREIPEYKEFHNTVFNKEIPYLEKKLYLENMLTYTGYSDFMYAERFDGKGFYLAQRIFELKNFNKNYIYRSNSSNALIVNNGKVNFTKEANRPINIHFFQIALKYLRIDFIEQDVLSLYDVYYGNKLLIDKVFTKKITNINDFNKQFLKSIKIKSTNALGILNKLYSVALKDNISITSVYSEIKKNKTVSSNDDNMILFNIYHLLRRYNTDKIVNCNQTFPLPKDFNDIYTNMSVVKDTMDMCYHLEETMNFGWSYKRILEFHDKLLKQKSAIATKFQSKLEFKLIPEIVEHVESYGYEILNTTEKVMIEADLMKHCIFTNYMSQISKQQYLALHYVEGNFTLGISIVNSWKGDFVQFHYNQLYGYRNKSIEEKYHDQAKEMIIKLNHILTLKNVTEREQLYKKFSLVEFNKKKLPIKDYKDINQFFGIVQKPSQALQLFDNDPALPF